MKGEVQGPASSTDNAIPTFDGTSGKQVKENTAALYITDDGFSSNSYLSPDASQDYLTFNPTSSNISVNTPLRAVDGLSVDTVSEITTDSGVTVDGVLLKDGDVSATDVSATGLLYVNPAGQAQISDIAESDTDLGVTVDGVLIKDGEVDGRDVSADGTKLDGIESGATQNETDAHLKNRANHTGTQAISTITDLQDELDSKEPILTGLYLSGSDYIETPDHSSLDITGDIDIRLFLRPDDWGALSVRLLNKWDAGTNNRSYQIRIGNNSTPGNLALFHSQDGSAFEAVNSSTTLPFSNGEAGWVRATREASSGDVEFFTSEDGETWTQLGTTVSGTSGNLHSGSADLLIGSLGSGDYAGVLYYAEIRDGIGGTVVANPDLRLPTPTRLQDDQGRVFTYTGSGWSWRFFRT